MVWEIGLFENGDFRDIIAMSQESLLTEEMIARQSPEARAIIRLLLAKIAELEARLNKTPRNSSLPPSTEHPHAKPALPKNKTGRKPGGQPGHPKHERALIPTDQCQAVIPVKPPACRRCGEPLRGSDPVPLRHQVWDVPEIKPLVTEYLPEYDAEKDPHLSYQLFARFNADRADPAHKPAVTPQCEFYAVSHGNRM